MTAPEFAWQVITIGSQQLAQAAVPATAWALIILAALAFFLLALHLWALFARRREQRADEIDVPDWMKDDRRG